MCLVIIQSCCLLRRTHASSKNGGRRNLSGAIAPHRRPAHRHADAPPAHPAPAPPPLRMYRRTRDPRRGAGRRPQPQPHSDQTVTSEAHRYAHRTDRGVCRVGADRWSPLALHAPQLSACGCAPGPRAGMAPAPAERRAERRGPPWSTRPVRVTPVRLPSLALNYVIVYAYVMSLGNRVVAHADTLTHRNLEGRGAPLRAQTLLKK